MQKKISLVLFLCLFQAGLFAEPSKNREQDKKQTAFAFIELGGDSYERRYFRPRLSFKFPTGNFSFFFDLDYLQRINSRLKGEVDFLINIGLESQLANTIFLEAGVYHLSRHITSVEYSPILDINEFLGRIWYRLPTVNLGIGGGGYLGPSEGYSRLAVFNLDLPHIFQSEFSLRSELKMVDFSEFFYDAEVICELDSSLDLFVRFAKHYGYQKITYLGLRINSSGKTQDYLSKAGMRASVIPDYPQQKALVENEFKLEFKRSSNSRVVLTLQGLIPVLRGRQFIGTFRPEKIRYPISLEYEKLVLPGLYGVGYCRYDIAMPLDVAKEFSSSLGIGIGIRNQPDFSRLDKKFRFEAYAGRNFSLSFDGGIFVGINTVNKPFDFGANSEVRFNSEEFYGQLEVFAEFGNAVKIRPFFAFEQSRLLDIEKSTVGKFQLGLELIHWR